MFGGFRGFGGMDVGSALIRIGADYSGLRGQTAMAVSQMRTQLTAATRGWNVQPTGLRNLNRELDRTIKRASALQTVLKAGFLGGGMFAVMGVGAAINAAIKFESAFAGVEKTVEATEEELAGLREEFLAMAREMPVAATTLARVGEAAGALGVAVPDIREFTKVVSTIGSTTNVSTDEAATALGQLSNVLNLTSDDYFRFAATLVDLGNKGASTEKQVTSNTTRRFGAAAKLFGLNAPQTLSIGSAAANLGMQPELASSALSRLTMRLTAVTSVQEQLRDMSRRAGLSIRRPAGHHRQGRQEVRAAGRGPRHDRQGDEVHPDRPAVAGGAAGRDGRHRGQAPADQGRGPLEDLRDAVRGMEKMDASGKQTFIKRLMGRAATAGGGIGLQQLMLGLADLVRAQPRAPRLGYGTRAWEANTAAVAEAEQRVTRPPPASSN